MLKKCWRSFSNTTNKKWNCPLSVWAVPFLLFNLNLFAQRHALLDDDLRGLVDCGVVDGDLVAECEVLDVRLDTLLESCAVFVDKSIHAAVVAVGVVLVVICSKRVATLHGLGHPLVLHGAEAAVDGEYLALGLATAANKSYSTDEHHDDGYGGEDDSSPATNDRQPVMVLSRGDVACCAEVAPAGEANVACQ